TVDADVFTQVNPEGNLQILRALLAAGEFQPAERVLELYCGAGNFTLPIAKRVREISAVEGQRAAIACAKLNAQKHGLENIRWSAAAVPQAAARLKNRRARAPRISTRISTPSAPRRSFIFPATRRPWRAIWPLWQSAGTHCAWFSPSISFRKPSTWRRWPSWGADAVWLFWAESQVEKPLRVQAVNFFLVRPRNIQFRHFLERHGIELIVAPAAPVRVVGAEENPIGAHRVVDELDERRANRSGGVVINLLEVELRLLLADRIALAPVEPVEVEQDHAAEM